ncbi:MAG: SAM-dependent chlorinase/fluorinase [Nitrospirae bacterium]|nr:SAM-dependent chlorinase/fluorinase [Nitrospirota bacterium]
MPHPSWLITLLTDFGDRDSFVASMKGVVLTINPQATFVDLSHHVPPHSVEAAAYLLNSCYRDFPKGTVHVAVVDPGVGSARRALIAKSERYFFLAPDNGLLTYILAGNPEMEVREIENKDYRLPSAGHTFDGRDLFAPAAAWLTKQQSFESFGRLVTDCKTFTIAMPTWECKALLGEIVHVDRFGNLISNLTQQHLEEVRAVTKHQQLSIRIGKQAIAGLVASYSEGAEGQPYALINSDGKLEIFVKEASAEDLLKAGRGARIEVS